MDKSQTSTGYGQRMEAMQGLMEEVLIIQRDGEHSKEAVVRVKEIVTESEFLVEKANGASELVIDGKILATGGHIVKQHVHNFDTNLKSFLPEEYTAGVIAFLESHSLECVHDWNILSSDTYSMFKKVSPLNYRLGTFKLDPPPTPEKIKPQKQKKALEPTKSVVAAVERSVTTSKETDEIYQHIFKCLVLYYRKNKKQPVNYFKFVMDPTDFWKTVQNIFHFSFLVRDDKVKMTLNENGIPDVEPLLPKNNSTKEGTRKNHQFNFRITPIEWQKIINAFEIKEPCITPFEQN